MSDETGASASTPQPLPDAASLEWLRKHAKQRLTELRQVNPRAKLADAQRDVARQFGFPTWRVLKARVDALAIDGQLFEAARNGDADRLAALLDEHPDKLHARAKPYAWTLLHLAAHNGRLPAVDLLLNRGFDVNTRETGDNTCAMHWAAAAGHLDVVRRLADARGDVVGYGDDHELEVIGWATCWDGCDDAPHRAIVDFLLGRGARHHIFSAIAMGLADEVRRIVARDPSALNRRMTRNDDHQMPLHFAVRRNRPEMVALLLELGADPLAVDGSGQPAAAYAATPDADRHLMQAIRALTQAELSSAERGHRVPRSGFIDLVAMVALRDWTTAERLLHEHPRAIQDGTGALHLMAKRNDAVAVKWLLDRGTDPNARWGHWDADVTPLHLAAWQGHVEVVRLLLDAGADPTIRDSKHDGDALGWAEHGGRLEVVRLLRAHAEQTQRDGRP
jgi:ankyrin repeat protein